MTSRFLQVHTLTSYPASLLNRDDVGFAKRMPFGDGTRTRISSQCLKRHWRTFAGDAGWHGIDGVKMSVRSRRTFDQHIRHPLVESGISDPISVAVTTALMNLVLGSRVKETKKKTGKEEQEAQVVESGQVTVLGLAELEYLRAEAEALAAELIGDDPKKLRKAAEAAVKDRAKDRAWKENLRELKRAAGLDAALFGRMVTSDLLAAGDAAVHVAHAFTVHTQKSESDYFSAVDDLSSAAGETGSGHINSTELTSGVFYGYVVVDLPLLLSNLEGCATSSWQDADPALAQQVVARLVRLIATVSPGAKLGSTAPYAYAHFVGVESGTAQPRTLANAFLRAVRPGVDPIEASYEKLAQHVAEFDATYGGGESRASLRLGDSAARLQGTFGEARSLSDLAVWASAQVTAR